ncbi:hypothetical protein T01_12824 [Trichinella spiralis]|uniref:Uncharacterized protein n=1 Tax=Trichinella spiralis TaxID=6334 RepID=A0A0V1AT92_TRISP|nr:hypothetical protein T01_12824 [Trichinella spiralis]
MHRNSTNKRTKGREIGQLRLPAWDRTGGRAPHLLFRYLWIFNQDPLLTNVDKLPSMTTHIRTPKWLLCPSPSWPTRNATAECCSLWGFFPISFSFFFSGQNFNITHHSLHGNLFTAKLHFTTGQTKTFVLFVITYRYFLFVKNPGQVFVKKAYSVILCVPLLGFVTLKNMLLERALNSFTRISISESLVSDYTLCNYVETTTTISQLEAKWNFFQSALMSETLCDVQLMRILTSLYFLGYTVTFSQTATLYNPAKKPIVIDDDCLQR